MRKSVRQKTNGWQWDYTSKRYRRFIKWKRGEGRYIKRTLSRARRQEAKLTTRREAYVY